MLRLLVATVAASLALAPPTVAANRVSVVAKVDFPRGLALAPDGTLYVASAGGIKDDDCSYSWDCESEDGRVYSIVGSKLTTVAEGFPASSDPGSPATGPTDAAVAPDGSVVAVTSGGDKFDIAAFLDTDRDKVAAVMTAVPGPPQVVAPLAPVALKLAADPKQARADPQAVLALTDRILVAVSGANAVLQVKDGVVSKFPMTGTPKYFFPTALALGPDGSVYVGEAAYYAHDAPIWKVSAAGGAARRAFKGFTDVSGIAFGPGGDLYVTDRRRRSISDKANPLTIDQQSGLVTHIPVNGRRRVISPKTFLNPIGAEADATGVFVALNTDQLAKESKATAKEMKEFLTGLRGSDRNAAREYLRASEVGGRIVHLTP